MGFIIDYNLNQTFVLVVDDNRGILNFKSY